MRVLEGVVHVIDYQVVVDFASQNKLFSSLKNMPFGRL